MDENGTLCPISPLGGPLMIIHVCSLEEDGRNKSDDDDDDEHGAERDDDVNLSGHLASLRRFLCTSSHAKDHHGCF